MYNLDITLLDILKKDLSNLKLTIVISLFYKNMSLIFLDSILSEFKKLNIHKKQIKLYKVPGAFESIYILSKLLKKNISSNCILCLGILIKGETPNFEYLSKEIIHSIAYWNTQAIVPIIYGILTTNDRKQALIRAKGEKSKHLAHSTIKMAFLHKNTII